MFAIGFDIGGTKIATGIISSEGKVVSKSKAATPKTANDLLDLMESEARELINRFSVKPEEVEGIGIGAPGPIDFKEQKVISFTNLPMRGFEIGAEISQRLKFPAVLDNDGNAAAIGEHLWGATKESDYSVIFTVGTGIGSGIIDKGKVLRGFRGSGAEIGHMVIDVNGPKCACGNNGCLESLVAGPAILRTALSDEDGIRSSTAYKVVEGDISRITTELITQQAISGDEYCLAVFQKVGRLLGVGIANILNILNPQIVAVGGGVGAAAREILLKPAREEAFARALPANVQGVKIVSAELGVDAGIMGAAGLVFKELSQT
jgi:glucokinase